MISKTWYQVKKASPKQLYIVLIQWWHSAAIKNYRNVERPWGWQSLDMDHLCRRWHNDWVDSYQFVYGIKWIELYVYTHTWVVVMGIAMDCINMNFGLERHSIINIIHYKWLKGAYYLPLSFAAPYKSLSFSKFKVKRTLSKCDTQHFFRHYCQGLTALIVIYSWNHGETGKRERSSTVSLLSVMLWNSTVGDFIKEGCLWTACLWRLTVEEREVPSFCCLLSVAWVVAQQGRETGV